MPTDCGFKQYFLRNSLPIINFVPGPVCLQSSISFISPKLEGLMENQKMLIFTVFSGGLGVVGSIGCATDVPFL